MISSNSVIVSSLLAHEVGSRARDGPLNVGR